jgi:PAS domain S-box-containing protein
MDTSSNTDTAASPRPSASPTAQSLPEQRLQALYEILNQSGQPFSDQFATALRMGVQLLELELGIISRIHDGKYRVVQCYAPNLPLSAGQVFDLDKTYCSLAYDAGHLVDVNPVSTSPYKDHDCYQTFHQDAYIGFPLMVNGERFGSLTFTSRKSRMRPFDNDDREFCRTIGTWVAATLERQMANDALSRSEASWRSLIESSPDIVVRVSPQYQIELFHHPNPTINAGAPFLIGQNVLDFQRPEYHEIVQLKIDQTFASGTTQSYELLGASNPEQTEFIWYHTRAAPVFENGKVVSVLLIASDIHARRLAEQQNQGYLRDMRALQELHLELSEIDDLDMLYCKMIQLGQQRLGIDRFALFVLDETGEQLLGTYGVDPHGQLRDERYYKEMITQDHWTLDIVNSPNHARFWDNGNILDNGKVVGSGWKAASALWNGRNAIGYLVSDNFVTHHAVRPYETELISIVGSTFGHLIERKQTEKQIQGKNAALIKANQELAIAREQAEAANKLKTDFLATMSHELRTPLNAIIGFAQLQLADIAGDLSEEQRHYQERILANAYDLLRLINEVLDLSKIEAGRLDLISQKFNLRTCLTDVVSQNRILAEDRGLALHLEIDARLPQQITGDEARIKQVVVNLLSNAIKFTETGQIRVTATQAAEHYMIAVEDTGIGIPDNMIGIIFEEFRQVDSSSHRQYGGTGLGLAIVKKLVILMRGTIQVKSRIGKGSTFTVTLPL